MTQSKAQTVASAIIGAGYDVQVYQRGAGNWIVRATAAAGVSVQGAADLATAQVVTGLIQDIEYS